MPRPFSGVLSLSFSLCLGDCQLMLSLSEQEGKSSRGSRSPTSWNKADSSRIEAGAYATSLCTNTELPGLISLTAVLPKYNHLWLCTLGIRSSRNCPAIQSAHSLTRKDSALLSTGRGTSMKFCQKTETTDSGGIVPYVFVGLIIYPKISCLTNFFLYPLI